MSNKRLIIHVGKPKTGTTALQYWCIHSKEILKKYGIIYPESYDFMGNPRHYQLMNALVNNDFSQVERDLFQQCGEDVLLSDEALSFSYFDFNRDALKRFKEKTHDFHKIIFMVDREKKSWTKSLYKQCIINPALNNCEFETTLTFYKFCKTFRVQKLMNTEELSQNLMDLLGAQELVLVNYEENWLHSFFEVLGIGQKITLPELSFKNISLSDDLIELIRQINAMKLQSGVRANILANIQKLYSTQHDTLKNFYKFKNKCGIGAFKKLKPKNFAQVKIIQELIQAQD